MNITASRMRHYIKVISREDGGFDSDPVETIIFDARADVLVRSGSEASQFGVTVTQTVITVLMWRDNRISNEHFIEWEGNKYRVNHVKNDEINRGMIVTCTFFEG